MCCSTKSGTAVVYFFPALYGALMIIAGVFELQQNPVLSAVCIIFGVVYLLTSVIGELGVWCLNEAAIRATVVLVVLENIIAFIFATFLLVDVLRARDIKERPHPSALLSFVANHQAATITLCIVLYVGSIVTSCCVGVLSEYQAQLDAELLLQETKLIKENEAAALLGTNKNMPATAPGQRILRDAASGLVDGGNDDVFIVDPGYRPSEQLTE